MNWAPPTKADEHGDEREGEEREPKHRIEDGEGEGEKNRRNRHPLSTSSIIA